MTNAVHQGPRAARTGTAPPRLGWRPASVLVLRMAGFPFSWLRQLAAPEVAATARECRRAGDRLDRLSGLAGSPDMRARAGSRADRAALRAISRGRPYQARDEAPNAEIAAALDEFTVALRARDVAAENFALDYHRACELTGAALIRTFREDPRLRDMLLVTNEDAYPRLIGWLDGVDLDAETWRKKDRNNLTTLVRYLQRVCAKNDTTSHFGPLATGRLDTRHQGVHWTPAGLDRRTVLSRWATEALAAEVAEDPTVWPVLRPRRAPGAVLDGNLLHVATLDQRALTTDVRTAIRVDEPVRLDSSQRVLYELCDGTTTIAQLAAASGEIDVAGLVARLRQLADLGAVVIGADLPYGVENSLACLIGQLADLDHDHPARTRCEEFDAAVESLRTAPAEARPEALGWLKELFTRTTGRPANRTHGGFYTDRSVFSEHCLGMAGDLVIGEPLATSMRADLGLLYDMFLLRPRWRLRLERELLATWFAGRFGRDTEVTMPRYLAAFLEDLDEIEQSYAVIDERVARIGDALETALLPAGERPDSGSHAHLVDRREVEHLVERFGVAEPAVCNPDLMVAAAGTGQLAGGDLRLVIGDLHAMEDHLSHGSIAPYVDAAFPRYRRELMELYTGLLAPGEQLADVTQLHLNKTFPRIEPDCWDIEAFDRSGSPAGRRLRLGDLVVRHHDDRLQLHGGGAGPLRLVIPPLAWPMLRRNPFAVFGFPTTTDSVAVQGRGRAHLPRIQVGDVVLQRELWRVPAGEITSTCTTEEPAAFLRVQALRERLGLPRHVYLKCPSEPKPVYCDLDSPLLVRQLTRMLGAAGDDSAVLTISEMLPGPDDLWLADDEGCRTSEIRYAVFSDPSPGFEPASAADRRMAGP